MMGPTGLALLLLVVWTLGALYGAYRYERLWLDRSLREIVADLREGRDA